MTASSNALPLAEPFAVPREAGPVGPYGFPQFIRVGDTVYVGAQTAADGGEIEAQTAASFDGLVGALQNAGADMSRLVNLRTYYVYCGAAGRDVTDYWERMTAVRLRYLADPGPAATALRVAGAPSAAQLIGVDGVASLVSDRQRIMPAHAWDWSIPTPFSQGWRVGDAVYVGGQISADRQGKAVAVGDVAAQTRHTLEYIRHVMADAGADWSALATLRICYRAGASAAEGRRTLNTILEVVREVLPAPLPALTAFGVDLLYEGLDLEIDAIALLSGPQAVEPAGAGDWIGFDDFDVARGRGDDVYIGGLSAPGAASLVAQAEATLERLSRTLGAAGMDFHNLVKLTVFHTPEAPGAPSDGDIDTVLAALTDHLPTPGPVLTILSVNHLPHDGQRFQLDAVATL